MSKAFLRSVSLACFTTAALATASVSAADTVTEQLELGIELYQDGEYGAAITELEFAINDIRKKMSADIAETFPEAPAGWTAEAAEQGETASVMLGGGSTLVRKYTQSNGKGKMEATIMIDNPMIRGLGAMLSNPALIATQKDMERIRIGRESGSLKWQADRGNAEAMLLLDGRILLQVKGQNLTESKPVEDLLRAWDLKALRDKTAR